MVSEMKKANKNVFSASFHRGSLPAIFEQTKKKLFFRYGQLSV